MTYPDFQSVSDELVRLFQEARFAEALHLATSQAANFPDDIAWSDYWRMCAAARLIDRPLVAGIAEQALAAGRWYGEVLWRRTPSFQTLQGDAEFERIVAESRAAEERDNPADAPPLMRLPDDHSAASPLLVALHGNQMTAAATLPFWLPALSRGWAVAVPQSNQAIHSTAFVWDDLARTEAHVRQHFARLPERLAFDARRVVLAGHSIGGLAAIQMALAAAVDVVGFVANGPAVPFLDAPEALDALLGPALQRGLRGGIIAGADDTDINLDDIRALADKLQAAGIACQLEIVPNARHAYTPDYDEPLLRALDFVSQT